MFRPSFQLHLATRGSLRRDSFRGGGFVTRQTTTNHPETFLITRIVVQTQYIKGLCGSEPIYQAILQKDALPREDSDAPIESFWEAILVEMRPFLY